MPREYRSFEEIDERLQVLKLQREIGQESLKLHFYRARADLLPRKIAYGLGTFLFQGRTWKNLLWAFAAKKVLSVLGKRSEKKPLNLKSNSNLQP